MDDETAVRPFTRVVGNFVQVSVSVVVNGIGM